MESQTPREEVGERIAEQAAGRGLPFWVMLQDLIANMASNRRRTQEGYKAQAHAAGFDISNSGDEEMGDINVSGDHEHHHYPKSEKSLLSKALPYIATAALTAGALNGTEILHSFSSMFQADYEIRFYDKDGNLVDVPRYDPNQQTKPDN